MKVRSEKILFIVQKMYLMKKLKSACKAVGLDHFVKTLPHGYDTVLNDQVQLITGTETAVDNCKSNDR